jgi:peroxiredoxin
MKRAILIGLVVALGLALALFGRPAGQAQPGPAPAPAFRPAVFGQPMPDFSLPAIQGGEYGPAKLKGKNVLFVFPRGKVGDHWCQICHYQYAELADLETKLGLRKTYDLEVVFVLPYGEAEVRHWAEIFPAQMAVIEGWKNPPGFDKLEGRRKDAVLRMRRFFPQAFDFGSGPAPTPFPILYDGDQAVSKMLGLFTTNWDRSAVDQNIPTIYLLNAAGEVRFKYTSQTTFDRPDAAYLAKILDKLILDR